METDGESAEGPEPWSITESSDTPQSKDNAAEDWKRMMSVRKGPEMDLGTNPRQEEGDDMIQQCCTDANRQKDSAEWNAVPSHAVGRGYKP
ncbi:hypothetical protein LINPERHAP2_LOCUS17000 [Linum perenne]